jgi:TonB family protein
VAQVAPAAFFSYCRADSDFALRLAGDLKAAGADVWLDQLDIIPGQRWDRAVEDTLTNCPRMVVILSPASVTSTNVMDEVSFALEEEKTVIPVIYRDCAIPFRLRRVQHVDFSKDYARGCQELLKTLAIGQSAGQGKSAQADADRAAAQPAQAEQQFAEKAEQERLASERADAERAAAQQAQAAQQLAEKAERERRASERAEAERAAAQQAQAAQQLAEKAERKRLASERAEAERAAAQAQTEQQLTEKAEQQAAGEKVGFCLSLVEKADRSRRFLIAAVVASIILALVFVLSLHTGPSSKDTNGTNASSEAIHTGKEPASTASVNSSNQQMEGVIGGIVPGIPEKVPKEATPQRVRVPQVATPQRVRVRVGQGVSAGLLIRKVAPNYPPVARQARVQGQVVLQAEISNDGTIQNLQLISGHPMLVPAAIEAVKQWRYRPYLLNGEPVAVETQVVVNFILSGD